MASRLSLNLCNLWSFENGWSQMGPMLEDTLMPKCQPTQTFLPVKEIGKHLTKVASLFMSLMTLIERRNPSLGLATKARVCKVAGQEGSWESHNILSGV
jgi:hypothetical protein